MTEDYVKLLAEAKTYLEKRLEELGKEIELIRLVLKVVDEALSQRSFVAASQLQRRVEEERRAELIETSKLTTRTGEELGIVEVYDDNSMVVRISMSLSASTQPLQAFLVRKILEPRKKGDEERVSKGEIEEDQAFKYEIVEEDGRLKEIRIRNYGNRDNLLELKSAIRWTLSKMLEKEKQV